jgi:DNA-binding CsgD family transcriptional regulator
VRAAGVAGVAVSVPELTGHPYVGCQSLVVLGGGPRPVDLDAAKAQFARARAIAEAHGLTVWRVRALHELGTIDLLGSGRTGRLEEAWSLATSVGALAVAAVLDVQIAAVLALSDEPESALVHTRRAAGLARRYGLAQTLAVALGFEAHVHARARRTTEMEERLREAEHHSGGLRDIASVVACCRTVHAFLTEDRAEALRHLDQPAVMSQGPIVGWWALLRSLDPAGGDDAVARAGEGGDPVHYLARPYLRYAEAVVLGRAGRAEKATAKVASGDGLLRQPEWLRHYGRRLMAEAALADGWGDPVAWLREAHAFFEGCGQDQVASACRSLLRRAGAPVPRRRQGSDQVPVPLRGLGVTARELEVLSLLAEGRSNQEIGARLYLSPRTVERHVANLAAKTGLGRRSQLVAFAARTVGSEAPPT